ncbi:MAG: YtxH domain-containing protein [Nitrospirae bacterium]|nr:YtxH domain-containing protein [Nitrospirota bacterium]
MKNNYAKIAGAFLVGGAIGAAIAVLYAPKSGRETRKDISKAARRMKEGAVDLVDDAIENVNDFVDDMKEKTSDIIKRGIELSEDAKEEIINKFEHAEKSIQKQRKKLMETLRG